MSDEREKLKVLVCAYACQPGGSLKWVGLGELILGWNIVNQLGRFHRIWVLTHSQNRAGIEAALQKKILSNVHFYYIDLPALFRPLLNFEGGIHLYAYLWQIKAYFVSRKLHQKLHFDVFHHVTYANDWMASFIGALLPIPYIRGPGGGAHCVPKGFFQEFSFREHFWDLLRAIGQWLFRHDIFFILGQRRARAIMVCSRESLGAIPEKWRQKTHLFPVNGITRRDLTLLAPRKINSNKFRVFSVGKLIRIKAFNLAIKAFKIFADKVPEAELTIIGDGPELTRLKNLSSKLDLEKKVHFLGWLPREELLFKMPSFDVFLFPGLGGTVVMEAMAAGKPVICLDIASPGINVTNDCGIKIKPYSPDQVIKKMAEALERLYRDKELRLRLGNAARIRVEREYRWDRLGERLLKIYQEVLRKNKA
ncbi:MAG: glycosyltransferase family 4 protein [Candidatus Nealsonbacteria bacterium]